LALADRLLFVDAAFQRFGDKLVDPLDGSGLRRELNLEFERLFAHIDGGSPGTPFTLISACYSPDWRGGPLDLAQTLHCSSWAGGASMTSRPSSETL
jgi:hypothetical protein